ncbi:MAG: DNA-directed RNA polymerase subunit alpha [Planctomycetes bacterium]|nr:DNA-directed RNA polymerase subunit alpha [Planctomycetota bacterium]
MKIRWKDFELPTGVECDTETLTDKYGSFWIEPFERGFGSTMGNSLRRILISSIQGAAVTAVRVEGISCEFENIDGVYQDTTEIVLNIKQLAVRMHTEEKITLSIEKTGPGDVVAGDFNSHQDVEIMNPDLVIATLTEDKNFKMEIEVQKGRGFVLARENMDKSTPAATDGFSVDSIYSPVQKVSHNVVGTRVGQRTDYERLEFEVWTNGVVSPKEALDEAASIMRKHINPFMSYAAANRVAASEQEDAVAEVENDTDREDRLRLPISVLEPSARTRNCLEAEGISTLGQLVILTEHELMKFRNFGQTSLNEIKEKLANFNLTIGMVEN